MNKRSNLELVLDVLVIILALMALALVAVCATQFNDTKAVYRGF